uniref:Uncharacterized protein n=1 Tax=Moniliophthora roreri TaxID=221103 RepID=A0A0W0FNK1_MONRR
MDLPLPKILGYTRRFPEVYTIYTLYREKWQSSYQSYLLVVDQNYHKEGVCAKVLKADKNPTEAALHRARALEGPWAKKSDPTKEALKQFPTWSEMSELGAE